MAVTVPPDTLQRLVGTSGYPCVMARSVLRRGQCTVGVYGRLGAAADPPLDRLAADLGEFAAAAEPERGYRSFVALFGGEPPSSEQDFERALWSTLRALHERDGEEWDPAVSSDPDDPSFSFSFAGRAFYIIGMHPNASRPARRSDRPALAFNLHDQFERLRRKGQYGRVRSLIRRRDRDYSGSVNPMVADFGESSEARQYSGRIVGRRWRCPFHPRRED